AVEERVVRVRLKGACVGCPSAPLDLRNVVERMVVEAVPGVARVENVF
ncbi:MAG: NifU family protein, partial [Thiohalospira sp.]